MSMSYFQMLSLEGESSDELKPLELSLHGPFADMVLLPSAGGDLNTPAAALLVLTSPGLLHIYDGAGIDSFFNAATEDGCPPSSLQPVPWQSPTTAEVVAVKLITVSRLAAAANVLIQVMLSAYIQGWPLETPLYKRLSVILTVAST